ncbi:MAG: DUF1580 domain-containing protein [Planctomycetaceae bacterium]|nr:DUF1580 domain-containing protein [Planctomycetaceae bacterium]
MDGESLPHLSDLVPLDDVCRLLPTRTHRSTVFRWAQKGRRGVRLRVVAVGGTKCTTEAWLMAFFAAVEVAGQPQKHVTPDSGAAHKCAKRRTSASPGTLEVLRRHGLSG